jgi:hypothetical protein
MLAYSARVEALSITDLGFALVAHVKELESVMVARRQQPRSEETAPAPIGHNGPPTDPLEVGAPLPNSIGKCADLYSDVRALRLAMDKEAAAVKARETEIREHIISNLSKSDDTGAAGLRYRAQIVMKDVPHLTDWSLFTGYILENDRFDLLQKRLGEKAVMDMIAAGEAIPGVERMKIPDVSITKI